MCVAIMARCNLFIKFYAISKISMQKVLSWEGVLRLFVPLTSFTGYMNRPQFSKRACAVRFISKSYLYIHVGCTRGSQVVTAVQSVQTSERLRECARQSSLLLPLQSDEIFRVSPAHSAHLPSFLPVTSEYTGQKPLLCFYINYFTFLFQNKSETFLQTFR